MSAGKPRPPPGCPRPPRGRPHLVFPSWTLSTPSMLWPKSGSPAPTAAPAATPGQPPARPNVRHGCALYGSPPPPILPPVSSEVCSLMAAHRRPLGYGSSLSSHADYKKEPRLSRNRRRILLGKGIPAPHPLNTSIFRFDFSRLAYKSYALFPPFFSAASLRLPTPSFALQPPSGALVPPLSQASEASSTRAQHLLASASSPSCRPTKE